MKNIFFGRMKLAAGGLIFGLLAVMPAGKSDAASLVLSQSSVTPGIGQTITIVAASPTVPQIGVLSVPTNINPSIASAAVSGTSVAIKGLSAGSTIMTICASNVGCSNIYATVSAAAVPGSDTTQPTSSPDTISFISASSSAPQVISFGKSEADIDVGQRLLVPIVNSNPGTAPVYYVNGNTNAAYASANIIDSNVQLTGISAGGTNITICQLGMSCGNLYAYVSSSTGSSAVQTDNALQPVLSSFSITSNNVYNSFMISGDALTFIFTFNRPVQKPFVMIGGSRADLMGSGSGPYTAIYTLNGSEKSPLSIALNYTNNSGVATLMTFTAVTNSASAAQSDSHYSFNRYLFMGMTKLNVSDPDVKALQQFLKTAGIYSGPVTGYFGDQTKAAVQAFQNKNGLDPIGVVGSATRALLNKGN